MTVSKLNYILARLYLFQRFNRNDTNNNVMLEMCIVKGFANSAVFFFLLILTITSGADGRILLFVTKYHSLSTVVTNFRGWQHRSDSFRTPINLGSINLMFVLRYRIYWRNILQVNLAWENVNVELQK